MKTVQEEANQLGFQIGQVYVQMKRVESQLVPLFTKLNELEAEAAKIRELELAQLAPVAKLKEENQ